MRTLAESLALGPADQPPPMIGRRIKVRRGVAWLDYGDDRYVLALPSAPSWARLVVNGAPVRICVLFEPLAAGAGQAETDDHVRRCFERGSMRWGRAYGDARLLS